MSDYPKKIVKDKKKQVHPIPENCKELEYRNMLTVDFVDASRINDYLIAICMNPSDADAEVSDGTVNKLIEHAYYSSNSYKGVIVLNVLPMYDTTPETLFYEIRADLISNYDVLVANNYEKIIECLKSNPNSDVLLAWGNWDCELLCEMHYNISRALEARKDKVHRIDIERDVFFPPHPGRKTTENGCFKTKLAQDLIEYYIRVLSPKADNI